MRVLRILTIGLLAAYAAALTVVVAFDDHRYHTTVFAPVPGQGWHEPQIETCGQTKVVGCAEIVFTYPDCKKFNPIQCWIYPNRGDAFETLEYDTKDLKIEVRAFDLQIPATGPVEANVFGDFQHAPAGEVQILVTVTGRNAAPRVDRSRIRVIAPCGPGVKRNADGTFAMTPEEFFTLRLSDVASQVLSLEPRDSETLVAIEADRASIQECTLRLRDAVAEPIPDLTLRAVPVTRYAIVTTR